MIEKASKIQIVDGLGEILPSDWNDRKRKQGAEVLSAINNVPCCGWHRTYLFQSACLDCLPVDPEKGIVDVHLVCKNHRVVDRRPLDRSNR